jgi:hypothetical protein
MECFSNRNYRLNTIYLYFWIHFLTSSLILLVANDRSYFINFKKKPKILLIKNISIQILRSYKKKLYS